MVPKMPPSLDSNMVQCLIDRIDSHFGIAGLEGYDVDWEAAERRVAEILGVQEGDKIPLVSRQTLRTYHAHLRANVKFPFKAKVEDLDGDATIESLFALRDCPDLTFYGLFVRGHHRRSLIEVPIATIETVKDKEPNKHLIEDYCMWFWNYR